MSNAHFVSLLCCVASLLVSVEIYAQQQTKTLGDLYAQPSFSSRSIASIPQYTSYQLLSSTCDKGWYHVYIPSSGKNGYMFYSRLGLPYGVNPRSSAGSFPSQNNGQEQTPLSNDANVTSDKIRFRQSEAKIPIEVVAVLSLDGANCMNEPTRANDEASVVEQDLLGVYGIVDRSHLEMVMEEQRLALSGLVMEEGALAKAGCLAGAQGTVIVTKGCLLGDDVVTIKMIDCTSSMMYWVASGPVERVYDIMDEVRSQLSK